MFYPLNDARTIGVTGGNRTLVDRSTVCRLSHSATATLGARSTSRTCLSGFSDRRLDRNGLPGEFGGRGGSRTLICWLQASGPPVERLPQTWLRAGELNATRMAYEASMTPVHLPASKMVREAGVEPAASRLSVECSNHAELFPGGALRQTRTDLSGLQVRRIAFYGYRARYSPDAYSVVKDLL